MHYMRKLLPAATALLIGCASAALSAGTASAATATPSTHTQQSTTATSLRAFKPSAAVMQGSTKTYTVPAPAPECAALKLPAGCTNTVTVHTDPAVLLKDPQAKIHGEVVKPNENVFQVSGSQQYCNNTFCAITSVKLSATFNFTGGWVQSAGENCHQDSGIGFNFNVTECGTWNNGVTSQSPNGGQMYDYSDTTVSNALKIPENAVDVLRNWCNVDGELWYTHSESI